MLFLHLSVTLVSLGSEILDHLWASYCNHATNKKLLLYSILVVKKRLFWLMFALIWYLQLSSNIYFYLVLKKQFSQSFYNFMCKSFFCMHGLIFLLILLEF